MDLNIQPMNQSCAVSGLPFEDGQRVASYLVAPPGAAELLRFDLREDKSAEFQTPGPVVCRWVHVFKARRAGESGERALKLTTENLFLTLADPLTEPTEENVRLLLFLALMLERKRLLRQRGRTADGNRVRYEHARTKQVFELPATELTPEFFVQVQEQLSVLVGVPKKQAREEAAAKAQAAAAALVPASVIPVARMETAPAAPAPEAPQATDVSPAS